MSEQEAKVLMPKLRFPEFKNTKNWNTPTLGEVSERITGKVGERKLTTVSITAGKGFVSQAEKFSRDISGKQYKNYIALKKGEFSYNKGNSKTFPQGAVYKLHEFDEVAAPNAFISFRFNDEYVADFYKLYFDNNFHGWQLLRYITSGARSDGLLNINPDDFFKIILPTPADKDEQQKIADCLSSVDELIAAEEQKLDNLKSHKKGLIQQLFPVEGETVPKLRFPEFKGEWKKSKLGHHIDLLSGYAFKSKYFTDDGNKLVTPKNFTKDSFANFSKKNTKFTTEECNSKYFCDEGDLLLLLTDLTPSCELLGKPLLLKKENGKVLLNQRIAKVIPLNEINIKYLLYFFLTETYHNRIKETATGSTVRHSSNKIVLNTEIYLPSPLEQQKIFEFLYTIDELISAQLRKIEALIRHRKGISQQLLPPMEEVGV